MMRRIRAIALSTFRESIRNKILYSMLFFAFGLLALAALLASLAIGDVSKIIRDIGLAGIHLMSVAIALFSGVNLIVMEIERRTIYTYLAKPLPRWEFIVGKWLGLALLLFAEISILACAYFAILKYMDAKPSAVLMVPVLCIYIECLLVVALACLFSGFSSPVVATFATTGVWMVGHMAGALREFAAQADSVVTQKTGQLVANILPNLNTIDFKHAAVHLQPLSLPEVLPPVTYVLGWVGLLLLLACWVYERKDFDG